MQSPLLVRVPGKMVCVGEIFELGTFSGPPTTQELVGKNRNRYFYRKQFSRPVFGALRDHSRWLSESGQF